jgi:hypothetical protein
MGLPRDLGLELTNTVYVLDSTTIDWCLSKFPWLGIAGTIRWSTIRHDHHWTL